MFKTLQFSKESIGTANHANSLMHNPRRNVNVTELQAQSVAGLDRGKSDLINHKNTNSQDRRSMGSNEQNYNRQSNPRRQSLGK